MLAAAWLAVPASVPIDARQPADPTTGSQEPVELDKCGTLRAPVESIIGALDAVPVHSYAPQQDMPSTTCWYRSEAGWLAITFTLYPERAQFERLAALVQGSARIDGLAEVALSIPPTPRPGLAGATIAAYHSGTAFTLDVASDAKTADQLLDELQALTRTVASDDRLLHGTDRQPTENQHLQGGG